ncbi:MAG: hypothetical protein H3C47_09205 [Candidatus Cloacimonetes bacterium]|nr:hypothetical protein [Candidatus Cloacimonadota bacterium]
MNVKKSLQMVMLLIAGAGIGEASGLARVNPEDFQVDAYENRSYWEKPLAPEALEEDLTPVDTYLNQKSPQPRLLKIDPIDELGLSPEETTRARLHVLEANLLAYLEEQLPEVAGLRTENEGFEFEVNHYLKLRRAELKEVYLKLESMEEKRNKFASARQADLDEVKQAIRRYYEEIDLHLESPSSAYNDDFVMHRKNLIRKLMKKELALTRDFRSMNYEPMDRIDKNIQFLKNRRDELLEQSKNRSFPFVVRKMEMIEKNNARINYLVSRLPEEPLMQVRELLSNIRGLKTSLAKLDESSSKSQAQKSLAEDVRFEQEYYARLREHDARQTEEAHRLKQLNQSLSATNHSMSNLVQDLESRKEKENKANQDQENKKSNFIYIVPMNENQELIAPSKPSPQVQMLPSQPARDMSRVMVPSRMPSAPELQSIDNLAYEEESSQKQVRLPQGPMPGAPERAQPASEISKPAKVQQPAAQAVEEPKPNKPVVTVEATETTRPVTPKLSVPVGFGDADDFALGIRDR